MSALHTLLHRAIAQSGGWIGFDRFMAMALYAPAMGYYSGSLPKLGMTPEGGSDFVTAPELSPWFGRTLAHSVEEALLVSGTDEIWEFDDINDAFNMAEILTKNSDSGYKYYAKKV